MWPQTTRQTTIASIMSEGDLVMQFCLAVVEGKNQIQQNNSGSVSDCWSQPLLRTAVEMTWKLPLQINLGDNEMLRHCNVLSESRPARYPPGHIYAAGSSYDASMICTNEAYHSCIHTAVYVVSHFVPSTSSFFYPSSCLLSAVLAVCMRNVA